MRAERRGPSRSSKGTSQPLGHIAKRTAFGTGEIRLSRAMMTEAEGVRASAPSGGEAEISIVMPCLNEREAVGACVGEALRALREAGIHGEVVVADNGSSDGSPEVARQAGARVVHEPARGYGNACRAALSAARGRYVVIGDSDGTYDFREALALVNELRNGHDYVIGNRLKGHIEKDAMPWLHRRVGVPVLTGLLNLTAGTSSGDAHSGMRAITGEALRRMNLRSSGMEFASEFSAEARRLRLSTSEIPIRYRARTGTSKLSRYRDAWRHVRFMLLYRPVPLFVVPGVLALLAGLALLLALLWGPVTVFGYKMDILWMAIGSILMLGGLQLLQLALFALLYKARTMAPDGPSLFTVERGLCAGAVVGMLGIGTLAFIFARWVSLGYGFGETEGQLMIRRTLFATTLVGSGVQIAFGSLLAGLFAKDSS